MVQRILVCYSKKPGSQVFPVSALLSGFPLLLVLVTAVGLQQQQQQGTLVLPVLLQQVYSTALSDKNNNVSSLALIAAAVSALLVVVGIRLGLWETIKSDVSEDGGSSKGVAVFMYPLGVQLATVSFNKVVPNAVATAIPSTTTPRLFLPRDQILDCIVTEVIWAHRVQSTVVFRVRRSSQCDTPLQLAKTNVMAKTAAKEQIQLVSAFPGAEMTYVECLTARLQINAYLTTCGS